MLLGNFTLILALVALNGFFVSVEFAAVAARRARIERLADDGDAAARIVQGWLERPAARDRLIAAAQLGITIVSLALGAVGENTFEALLAPYFHPEALPARWQGLAAVVEALPLVIALVIVTSLHVVLGEQVPKVAALHDPERIAVLGARPMQGFARVFKWFIDILDWATRHVLRLVGLQMVGEHTVLYSIEEIKRILDESEESGVIQSPEHEMLHAIFDLEALQVGQVMVPRTEITAIAADAPLSDLVDVATETNFTKFPVYDDTLDHVTGIVHVKDLVRLLSQPAPLDRPVGDLAREALYVPETVTVNALLHKFRTHRQHIAIVMDEYGGTAGLVTLEDLLEEIVGEVSDPFDASTPEIQPLSDGTWSVDGLALIDEVNAALGLYLRDEHYDTIAGYVLGRLDRIPAVGDVVEGEGARLRVEAMDGLRIARLIVATAG
ncbi:HlyC/CorC family transporter [bacterium]|nr:HlyC/CorC family transporter [Chloroflexi bacterium CFX6]RIL10674.1 MAG: HlyC/CorC family transporter [bacterium]